MELCLKILYYLLMAAALLALLINRQRLDRRLHLFIPLLVAALLPDGTKDLLGETHWLYHFFFSIYSPIEYLLLCIIIASYLEDGRFRKIIYYSIPFFVIASFIIQVWVKPLGSFYKYLDVLIEAPLLCVWTLLYFFQLAADKEGTTYKKNPMFWISIGNLLFYSVSTFSYGFGEYLRHIKEVEYAIIVLWIAMVFNLVLYIFYIIAFTSTWVKVEKS